MTYRSFSLIPTFNNHLFSDRFTQMDNLFSRLTGEKPIADTPAYNLVQKGKEGKEHYELTINVPGYSADELDILTDQHQITISAKINQEKAEPNNEKGDVKWLHQGIKKSDFCLSFNLEHRVVVKQSSLHNGVLLLVFFYDIPEREKPKKITINVQGDAGRVIEHHGA